MEWRDRGIILAAHRHGEYDVRLEVLTVAHGRAFGLVKGGQSRKMRGLVQPGNQISVLWRARLETHLGTYAIEPVKTHALAFTREQGRLQALVSCCALAAAVLPEKEAHGPVHDGLAAVISLLDAGADGADDRLSWGTGLVRWESGLLRDLGFGLDLSECAATGARDDLTFVSPKSGRAVSSAAGAPYAGRLLPLPAFLLVPGAVATCLAEVRAGLTLTGFFLERYLLAPHGRTLPPPRKRLMDFFASE